MDCILKNKDEIFDDLLSNAITTVNKLMLLDKNKSKYPIATKFLQFQEDNTLDFNFLKQNLDNLLNKEDEQPKNVHKIKVPIDNFNLEMLKTYTENLSQPCIFEFETRNSELDDIKTKLLTAPTKTVYDKNSGRFYQSSEFNETNQNIFNQSINKVELLNYFPNLNNYLVNGDGFISKKGDFTAIHNEIELTLNVQIEGKKLWVLIDTIDTDYVFPIKSSNVINYYSLFSGNKELYEKFHKKIPRYEVILEKDQFLFVPAWYYHAISTLENSVSLSMRYAIPVYSFNEFYLPKNAFNYLVEFVINSYMFLNLSSVDINSDDLELKNPLVFFIKNKIFPKIIGVTSSITKTEDSQFAILLKQFFESYLLNK